MKRLFIFLMVGLATLVNASETEYTLEMSGVT